MTNFTNNSLNSTEHFYELFCQLADFPNNGRDCSVDNPNKCVQCSKSGVFLTGDMVSDVHSTAVMYYTLLWIATVLTSLLGIFFNLLIIKVIPKSRGKEQSQVFNILLFGLAIVDAINCVTSIVGSTALASYFGNWFGRGAGILYWIYSSMCMSLLLRSSSTYVTVLITITCYLAVAFPIKWNVWLTDQKAKLLLTSTLIFAALVNYPRFLCWSVETNQWKDVPAIKDLEYVVRSTDHGRLWEKLGDPYDPIDFLLPPLLLLLFNLMSFCKVHEITKKRREMNVQQKQDVSAVRMFLPVVVVYFVTYSTSFFGLLIYLWGDVVYREAFMVGFLSNVFNSAATLPIYFWRRKSFRQDLTKEVSLFLRRFGCASYILEVKESVPLPNV